MFNENLKHLRKLRTGGMTMKFKIGDMKAKNIVNNILITGLLYFIIFILHKYSFSLAVSKMLQTSINPDSMVIQFNRFMAKIHTISTYIVGFVSFKLSCEVLYKLLRAYEIIIEKYDNK